MTTIHGNSGQVRLAANLIANVTAFTYRESQERPENHAMGATSKSYKAGGPIEWGGSITMRYDKDDAQQISLVAGFDIADLRLQSEGQGSGKVQISGPAYVESVERQQDMGSVVEATVNYVGNGDRSLTAQT